ncbi:MAG: hypothetical protein KBC66_06385 [Kiritimatiellae bacterium]|jgi:hypothetical protein|nr:hypothetical protein [Kiritimatiellia bacterium]NLD89039.1 hypothetical protein [Lentisphaerota bacterium]HOU20818.1 DUF6448 family protein [Kiritimatiellia bacterium]HPC19715.1 DUF6448 family protein [Kiritimatiellia bacterium]HQN79889.1 DUF6448 family protein [Kiritimatiellia bacterium]
MRKTSIIFVYALVAALAAGSVFAHCDTANGPVIPEAKAALAAGDATPILKWVMPADEEAVKTAFAKAVAVRTQSPEAQELADQYFLETLVRLHRAGEGAPYTGIKDEPVEPIVALADGALAAGSADEMIGKITGHVGQAVREKFDRALQARKHKDDSVEAGREYVAAYVAYVHFVEGVHAAVMSAGSHAHAPATAIHEAHAE